LADASIGNSAAGTALALPETQIAPLRAAYARLSAARRRRVGLGMIVFAAAIAAASRVAEIDPLTVWHKIGGLTSYLDRIATLDSGARVWTDPAEWFWGLWRWLRLLGETLLMSYVGTLIGAATGVLLCFASSHSTNRSLWLRLAVRRLLEFCRTVPTIVFALVFVVAFGLGPLPGVLALGLHTTGALGKLFTEVVENADMRPAEGVRAGGATLIEVIRFGILPQVLPSFTSYTLLRFENNLRDATVMGFVGAGGIGDELMIAIRRFYYSDVSAILVLIILTVFVMDLASEGIRKRLSGGGAAG
jgi:phosphonate transport system permease protein